MFLLWNLILFLLVISFCYCIHLRFWSFMFICINWWILSFNLMLVIVIILVLCDSIFILMSFIDNLIGVIMRMYRRFLSIMSKTLIFSTILMSNIVILMYLIEIFLLINRLFFKFNIMILITTASTSMINFFNIIL
jgi:hypothetical protein